jgi:hydrogenase nickel incorporation protein HypA/HybF
MHEWSVAEAVIRTVQDWADGRKVKIKRVVLGIPAVSFLDSDLLKEAFDTLKRDSILEDATLIVRFKSPTFHCNSCNRDFSLDDVKDQLDKVRAEFGEDYPMHLIPALAPAFIRCPHCGSHDISAKAQDITIDQLEVEGDGGPQGSG